MSSETEILKMASGRYGGLYTSSIYDKQVHDGNVYTSRKILTIPAGVSYIVFDATSISESAVLVLPPSFSAIGGDRVEIGLHTDLEYTPGTGAIIVPANRNLKSLKTTSAIIEYNPTITNPGINGSIEWLLPSNAQGGKVNSGNALSSLPFEIIRGVNYGVAIDNKDTNPQFLEFVLTWLEVPDNDINE